MYIKRNQDWKGRIHTHYGFVHKHSSVCEKDMIFSCLIIKIQEKFTFEILLGQNFQVSEIWYFFKSEAAIRGNEWLLIECEVFGW